MIRPATNTRTILSLSAVALLVTGAVLYAGPLNPPAGPVASTAKTLAEIEPRIAINATNTPGDNDATPSLYKITQPGSYYLTGNISLVNARSAVEITSSGVTLDLNGFTISGVGGLIGVTVTNPAVDRIVIRNGRIINFLNGGIDANVPEVEVNRINVKACGVLGIRAGTRARITDCTVTDCHTNANGIAAASGSIVDRCVTNGNTGVGIVVATACVVSNSTSMNNTGNGFTTDLGSIVTTCSASDNGIGISTNSECTVIDCVSQRNTSHGIRSGGGCIIRGNTCAANGTGATTGYGIQVLGDDTRIEGNNCTVNDRGIDVFGTGNIIIRNTCSGNSTNWVIAFGNAYGPIIATPAGAAVNGNTAAAALATTDPHANFSY